MARGKQEVGVIVVEAGVLARAMKHAAGVVEARNTLPILANVRLTASDEGLEVVASDLDVEFRQVVPLVSGGALATTVEAARLSALAGAVEGGAQIALALEDKRLVVKSGRSRWTLPVLPAEDFPVLPFEGEHAASVAIEPASALARAIGRTLWAASTEVTRPWLTGALLHAEGGRTALVGTDGNVLVRVVLDREHPADAPEVILGPKFCRQLQALTDETAGPAELAWDTRKIRARIGPITLTGKMIEGTFPNYRLAIPPEGERVIVDPATLRAAARRVMLVSSEKTRVVRMERAAGKLVLSHSSPDSGAGLEDVPADAEPGPTSGFQLPYLDRMLEAIGGEGVEIHHNAENRFSLVRRVVPDGSIGVLGGYQL